MHEETGGVPDDPRDRSPEDDTYAWLKRGDGGPDAPIFYTTAVRVGEDPWRDEVLARELEPFVEDQMSALQSRGDEDGAWVLQVTDLVEEPQARVRAAIALARLWSERGLQVVLVDADVRFVGLARHLDDEATDAEGFVDALEYGASGSALLRSTPLDGVRVLPIGSYRPDHTASFSDEARRRLIRQLRASADVVLVIAPAWTADGRFHPLLVHSDAVLLSFDLDRSLAQVLDELRRYLDGLGIPLAAMAARVVGDPEASAVDVALSAAAESGDEAPAPSSSPYASFDHRAAEGEGSSPLVRNSLMALVLVLLAFVGWWGWTEFSAREKAEPELPVAHLQPPAEPFDTVESGPPATEGAAAADSADSRSSSSTMDGDAPTPGATVDPDAATDSSPTAEAASDEGDDAAEASLPGRSTVEVAQPEVAQPEPVQPEPVQPEQAQPELAGELYLAPRAGWALHPWSFADSTDAVAALRSLEREGMHPVVRGARIRGSRWYRVLVGNFATRGDAWRARDGLASRVRADWIGVVRVDDAGDGNQ